MSDAQRVFNAIYVNPGHRTSFYEAQLGIPYRVLEDLVWQLWRDGKIQMEPDSTLRVTRDGEKVFRYDY